MRNWLFAWFSILTGYTLVPNKYLWELENSKFVTDFSVSLQHQTETIYNLLQEIKSLHKNEGKNK